MPHVIIATEAVQLYGCRFDRCSRRPLPVERLISLFIVGNVYGWISRMRRSDDGSQKMVILYVRMYFRSNIVV